MGKGRAKGLWDTLTSKDPISLCSSCVVFSYWNILSNGECLWLPWDKTTRCILRVRSPNPFPSSDDAALRYFGSDCAQTKGAQIWANLPCADSETLDAQVMMVFLHFWLSTARYTHKWGCANSKGQIITQMVQAKQNNNRAMQTVCSFYTSHPFSLSPIFPRPWIWNKWFCTRHLNFASLINDFSTGRTGKLS